MMSHITNVLGIEIPLLKMEEQDLFRYLLNFTYVEIQVRCWEYKDENGAPANCFRQKECQF